jgi:hypothetical protein
LPTSRRYSYPVTDVVLDSVLTSPVLRGLRDYWREKAATRDMPSRADLDPIDIPRFLPHIAIADVFHNPRRYRHRLLGTFITTLYERDSTGKWIGGDLYGTNAERMLWVYDQCVASRASVAIREALTFARKDWVAVEGLLMPLVGPDGQIYMIFGGLDVVPGRPPMNQPDWRIILDCDL